MRSDAPSLTEGLQLAERADIDLALLDINVGGYNSESIAQIIERLVTGYTSTGLPPPFSDRRVLPFRIEVLKEAIRRLTSALAAAVSSPNRPNEQPRRPDVPS
jgi:hypothetical protein